MGSAPIGWLQISAIFVTAYVLVFAGAWVSLWRDFLGAQVDFLPALMVYCGVRAGLPVLASVAVAGGLWFDTLSANPLGVSILPLFFSGLAIHAQRELILRQEAYAQFVLGVIASAMAPALSVFLLFASGSNPALGWVSLWQWLVMALAGGAATPALFAVFDRLSGALTYQAAPESVYRADREIKRGRI